MKSLILLLAVIILTGCSDNPVNTAPKYIGIWESTVNNLTFTIEIVDETDKRAKIICYDMEWVWNGAFNNGSHIYNYQDQKTFEYVYYISGDEMHGTLDIRVNGDVWYYGECTFTRQ